MATADETVWLSYNGEVYNFRELRARLEARGHVFRTKSDTEVILEAYRAYGDRCVEHLRGMFAFGLWDVRRRRLLLARDRLGIKPLYYTVHAGRLVFASEIKAILTWPGIPRRVDPVALRDYLAHRYVPGPRTMFDGIFKLQPGHTLVVQDGRVRTHCYWDVPLDGEVLSPDSAARLLRERLEECVEAHLVSDVPLGVFLSGGLDSTAVTGLTSSATPGPLQTFAVGYRDGGRDDERGYARLAAARFGTDHHELALDSSGFWDLVPWMVWSLDEPVADAPCIPLYLLSRLARRHVTVALSGEGADEILAGYGIYQRVRSLRRWGWLPGLSLLRRGVRDGRLRRALARAALPLEQSYRGVSDVFDEEGVARLMAPSLGLDGAESPTRRYFERTAHLDPLRRMLYLDLKLWLPDDLLVKADKMTMASSIELRVPFLDHTLVEWAWRLPSDLKLRGGVGKYALRQAVGDLVPREILDRPKQGFTIPISGWLRRELGGAARRLLVDEGGHRALLDRRVIESMLARHEAGREDLSTELFTLVVFALWHRLFIDGGAPTAPAVPADV